MHDDDDDDDVDDDAAAADDDDDDDHAHSKCTFLLSCLSMLLSTDSDGMLPCIHSYAIRIDADQYVLHWTAKKTTL